jgi:predicted transcriptional regulator
LRLKWKIPFVILLSRIYHKTLQVYTEKEILALAAKAGVTSNTIADINQVLIDDGLVDKEKIGGSNYFWSFPAKKDRKDQIDHEQTLKNVAELKVKVEEASAKLADAKRGREEDKEGSRARKLARLAELAKQKVAMEAELEVLKENDPAALADLEKELQLVRQAAHRWTDNIFECKTYLVKKRGMDKKDASRYLGITADFDCTYTVTLMSFEFFWQWSAP